MKKIIWILLYVFITTKSFAVKKELREPVSKSDFMKSYQKATEWFTNTPKFCVSVTYSSFKDHSTLSPFERSMGVYLRDGKKAMTTIMGIKTIENEKFRFSIDTTERLIVLTNKSDKETGLMNLKSFEAMLDQVKSLTKQKSPSGGTLYVIEFKPDGLYSLMEVTINESGRLEKEVFYYAMEMKEEVDEADEYGNVNKSSTSSKPRLEISFSNYQSQLREEHVKELSEQNYFSLTGKKVIPIERYKTYKIKDYRFDLNK